MRGISYILLRRLHVWLSTELQSWHFNQEPSEASLADKRSCTSPCALSSNSVFTQEIHSAYSRTNRGASLRPFTRAPFLWPIFESKGNLAQCFNSECKRLFHNGIHITFHLAYVSLVQVTSIKFGILDQWCQTSWSELS